MKKNFLFVAIAAATAALIGGLILMYTLPLDLQERTPDQPLAFSHKAHAGDNGIHCLYCHRYAPESPRAGIPSVSDCRACHLYIAAEKPEIKKLMTYWERREPIPWARVYRLPDHVYFPHMMHMRAALACTNCHGDVAGMDQLTRVSSLKMGWCLDCHKQKQASIDCWICHI